MAHSNSPIGQWAGVVPAGIDSPAVAADLLLIITAAEKQINMVFATISARDTALPSPIEGMECHITATGEKFRRIAGSWVKTYPLMYNGTGTPATSLGVVGDLYVQYS